MNEVSRNLLGALDNSLDSGLYGLRWISVVAQHRRDTGLAVTERNRRRRKPQIAFHDLARIVFEAVYRVRRCIFRSNHPDAFA